MLNEISTRWPLIHDPAQFVLRYAPAIEGYLSALVGDPDKVDEIRQDFLLKVVQKGFRTAGNFRGRFRNYLKAAVRNAALSHLRRKTPKQADPDALAQLPDDDDAPDADGSWVATWRQCALERVWDALELHQRQHPDNFAHTVLKTYVEHHETEDSEQLAARAGTLLRKPLRPDAYRKQLSRARRLFAKLLVQEIVQTLEEPTPDRVEAELIDVGLLADVQRFVPEGWSSLMN
jgi:RNA polymerase sigma-70 factor (ECF subfamily)